MNTDMCKLLYPSRIYCFSECQVYTQKKTISCYQVALFWAQTRKLDAKYSTKVCQKNSVKSVQSALSDLLTTSATHGTFSRPSTKRELILISLELNTSARESFEHC